MTATEKKPVKKPDVPIDNEKSQLAQDVEMAMANLARIQATRAESPDGVFVNNVLESERKRLEKQYLKDDPDMEAGFNHNTPQRHRKMLSKGWIPVTDELNGKTIHVSSEGGDLMYKRPKVLTQEALKQAASMANRRINQHHKRFEEGAPSETIFENETTISKGKLE